MSDSLTLLVICVSLLGTFFLTAISSAFRKIQKRDVRRQIDAFGKHFFYRPFHHLFFPRNEYEGLFFSTICAQSTMRFFYYISAAWFVFGTPWMIAPLFFFFLLGFVVADYLPRLIGWKFPEQTIRFSSPIASFFMFISFPLTLVFLKAFKGATRAVGFDDSQEPTVQAKQEIIEMVESSEVGPSLDKQEKELFESVLDFRERIVREVMVPRVDMFSLSVDTSIKDAANRLHSEGYSRTPVYQNSVDNVVGVLMYKDILAKYMEYEQKGNDPSILEAPIETIQKNAIYTPETKRLSSLLQEFRKKQVHLAIVVDEYGGTEGIVTIEDILEELVGEIEDEYDVEEEEECVQQPDGSWIVDARMSILDLDERTGVEIPQTKDYDTLGGYVFHCAGTIPPKGFIIHHDALEMEILRSNERRVEKVKIKPIKIDKSTDEQT